MQKHLTDGELHAVLDGELEAERLRHLETCTDCQRRQELLKVENRNMKRLLAFLRPGDEPVPSAQVAWDRFTLRRRFWRLPPRTGKPHSRST